MKSLSRRSFLRGLASTVVGLPTLEAMLGATGEAYAEGGALPLRFVLVFDGQSLGKDGDSTKNLFVPDIVGTGYDLKTALEPLAGVKDLVSVISGLRIPQGTGPGHWSGTFHPSAHMPSFTGHSYGDEEAAKGPSGDQIVADAIGQSSRFRSLNYRVQASANYSGKGMADNRTLMSYRRTSNGSISPVTPQVSPAQAYQSLFTGFSAPTTPGPTLEERLRRSSLSYVREETAKLLSKLGAGDRQRMEQHLQEIRDLENRLLAGSVSGSQYCRQLVNPGADPTIGYAYSNETVRGRSFCDLIHMALTCDMTRAASLMITTAQSFMSAQEITGFVGEGEDNDIHGASHSGNSSTLAMSRIIAWHVDMFAYLVGKLRDTPEGSSNVLARTAAVFHLEGGCGPTGEVAVAHSTENMAALIAGGAGNLDSGKHVVATGMHPVHVINTAMRAVGVMQDLGEVQGVIPTLFKG